MRWHLQWPFTKPQMMWFGLNLFVFFYYFRLTHKHQHISNTIRAKNNNQIYFWSMRKIRCPTWRDFFFHLANNPNHSMLFMFAIRTRLINVCTYVSIDTVRHFIRFVFGFSISHPFCCDLYGGFCCCWCCFFFNSLSQIIGRTLNIQSMTNI